MKFFLILFIILSFIGCPNEDAPDKTDNQSNQKITSLQALITNCPTDTTLDLTKYADWTITDLTANKNIVIEKALNINAGDIDLNNVSLTVKADGVQLTNLNNAKVTADKSLGSGSLKIASSSLSSLDILGGGIHSIYILDVSVDTITVDQSIDSYREDIVRLVYDASTDFNSLIANSDMLLYYDGQNAAPVNASKITVGSNVNVASNTAIDSSDSTSVASVKLTDDSSPSLYVLANNSDTLSEALLNQSIAYITKDSDLALEASNVKIDYTQSFSNGAEYTIVERNKFGMHFDYGAEYPFILVNETTGQETNFGITGNTSPLYSDYITDNGGNLYFIHNSSKDSNIKIVSILYKDLNKLINGDNNIGSTSYLLLEAKTDIQKEYLNNQYIRLAMYEKGATKHLFVLQTQLWSNEYELVDETTPAYNSDVFCIDVTVDAINNTFNFNQIGLKQIGFDSRYIFAEAITVDQDESLYLAYNSFDIKLNNSNNIIFDYSPSLIRKYYFEPLTNGTETAGFTEIQFELKGEKEYDTWLSPTIKETDLDNLPSYTLLYIISNYSFGINNITPAMISQF